MKIALIAALLPAFATAEEHIISERLRKLLRDDMSPRERAMIINKYEWPECVRNQLTAMQCKEMIDQEILTLNTGIHTTIRSVIVPKRGEEQEWYNAVVIPLFDSDGVAGRNGDGLIYYDFLWHSNGKLVTEEADIDIPCVEVDPETLEPVQCKGATLNGVLAGEDQRPVAGGNFDPNAISTPEGQRKLEEELNKPSVVKKGPRVVGPWDCTGMSGVDCCLMIKHEVRDMDKHNHAIQCYLDYQPGTKKYYEQQYNARVRIFQNHEGFVSQIPYVG